MTQNLENDIGFELVDSHCHLDFPEFDENRNELIQQCKAENILKFVVPGVSKDTWPRLKNISGQYAEIFPAYGLHPYFLNEHASEHVGQLHTFLKDNSAVAVGEIGLDYYLKDLDKTLQQCLFAAQLDVAKELNLPVILHVRKAHDDVLQFLKHAKLTGGSVHAFNGSFQQAKQYIDLGYKLGFGGALTFDRAKHLRKLAEQLPLDAILLETDSPDMSPANYSQSFNTPLTILDVLYQMSQIRQQTSSEIASQTTQNSRELFSL